MRMDNQEDAFVRLYYQAQLLDPKYHHENWDRIKTEPASKQEKIFLLEEILEDAEELKKNAKSRSGVINRRTINVAKIAERWKIISPNKGKKKYQRLLLITSCDGEDLFYMEVPNWVSGADWRNILSHQDEETQKDFKEFFQESEKKAGTSEIGIRKEWYFYNLRRSKRAEKDDPINQFKDESRNVRWITQ